jgi:hypothetical protein
MKLHNPFEVAMDGNSIWLAMCLVITVVLCSSLFIVSTLHFFGPWFLLSTFGIVLGGRILYAVMKGK